MTIVGGISVVAFLLVLTILVVVYIKCKKRTKLPPADVISEHQITKNGGVSCKLEAGDRTSNYSDLKVDISGGYVPYGDYSTHYSPPPQYLTTCSYIWYCMGCGTWIKRIGPYQIFLDLITFDFVGNNSG